MLLATCHNPLDEHDSSLDQVSIDNKQLMTTIDFKSNEAI